MGEEPIDDAHPLGGGSCGEKRHLGEILLNRLES